LGIKWYGYGDAVGPEFKVNSGGTGGRPRGSVPA
jgi:hypothetical protein